MCNRARFPIAVFLLPLMAGCSASGPPTATITGKVYVDGRAVSDGFITFIAQNGQPYHSAIMPDSTYRVEGVPLGEAIVTLRDADPPGEAERMVTIKQSEGKSAIPATRAGVIPKKYSDEQTTDLRFEVKPGTNNWDPPLKK